MRIRRERRLNGLVVRMSSGATKETYVWRPGMPDWRLAESAPKVLRLAALMPPPVPTTEE